MSGELPASAEVVVIGGGAIGCSLTYHLARNGLKPLLLERAEIGSGSTGRSAGGVRQQFSTEINIRLGQRSIHLLRRFEEELGVSADFKPIGYLLLASDAHRAADLRRNVPLQRKLGVDVELIDRDAVTRLVPGLMVDDLEAATYCPSDGIAGPHEVSMGYARAAERAGARVEEGVEVVGITRQGERIVAVETRQARVATPQVVNCGGPQAAGIGQMAGVRVDVSPVRRHLFLSEPFDGMPVDCPLTIDLDSTFYFRREGVGLLMGMSNPDEPVGDDTSIDWSFLPRLFERGIRRFPAIEHAGIQTGWAGLYEVTADHQPLIGNVAGVTGFSLACGFSGHGFMMAPSVGESLAATMAGAPPVVDLTPFDPGRFAAGRAIPESVVA